MSSSIIQNYIDRAIEDTETSASIVPCVLMGFCRQLIKNQQEIRCSQDVVNDKSACTEAKGHPGVTIRTARQAPP
jgi:hypothetical protein